jgi:hypothetical protein
MILSYGARIVVIVVRMGRAVAFTTEIVLIVHFIEVVATQGRPEKPLIPS